ncbi:hypothetical protein RI367_003312 [Sorochytrium milnesiophthora]
MKPGDRVSVDGFGEGVVRFVGAVHFRPGDWTGIELLTPSGKNDGSAMGKRYFACAPNHGVFVPANSPTVQMLAFADIDYYVNVAVDEYDSPPPPAPTTTPLRTRPAARSTTTTPVSTRPGISRTTPGRLAGGPAPAPGSPAQSPATPLSARRGVKTPLVNASAAASTTRTSSVPPVRRTSANASLASSPRARAVSVAPPAPGSARKRSSLMPAPELPPSQHSQRPSFAKRLTLSSLPSPLPDSPLAFGRNDPTSPTHSQYSEYSYPQQAFDQTRRTSATSLSSPSLRSSNEDMLRMMQELKTRAEGLEAENKFLRLEVDQSKAALEISRLMSPQTIGSDDAQTLVGQQHAEETFKAKEQEYQAKLDDLEKQVRAVLDEKQQMVDDIKLKVNEMEHLKLQNADETQVQVIELQRTLKEKEEQLKSVNDRAALLQTELEARNMMAHDLDDITKSIELLETESERKSNQVRTLEKSLDETRQELAERSNTIADLERTKLRLEQQHKTELFRIETLEKEIEEQRARFDALVREHATNRSNNTAQAHLDDASATIAKLESELSERNAAMRRLEHTLSLKSASYDKLEQELSELWSTKTQLELQLNEKTRTITSLMAQLDSQHTSTSSASDEFSDLAARYKLAQQRITTLEKRLAAAQSSAHDELGARLEELQVELGTAQKEAREVGMLRTKVAQLGAELAERDASIDQLQGKAQEQATHITDLETRVRDLKKARRETISSYMENIEILMTDMTKLQAKYDDVAKRSSMQSAPDSHGPFDGSMASPPPLPSHLPHSKFQDDMPAHLSAYLTNAHTLSPVSAVSPNEE